MWAQRHAHQWLQIRFPLIWWKPEGKLLHERRDEQEITVTGENVSKTVPLT
jgi:hypothetical protein